MRDERKPLPRVFRSDVDELYEQLKRENRITELTDAQIAEIDSHISREMDGFRAELRRKQAQSESDAAKIILSA